MDLVEQIIAGNGLAETFASRVNPERLADIRKKMQEVLDLAKEERSLGDLSRSMQQWLVHDDLLDINVGDVVDSETEQTPGGTYLEFVHGRSNKFWELVLNGASYTVRWGPRGSMGQSLTKDFDSPVEAKTKADRLIASKIRKGYR